MAVSGVHLLLHSPEAERLRAALHELFGWSHVEAHPGWPIFGLPPAELAVHPADEAHHEISLMCDDLDGTLAELLAKGVEASDPQERRFGRAVTLRLPGGTEVLLYEPTHPTAISGDRGFAAQPPSIGSEEPASCLFARLTQRFMKASCATAIAAATRQSKDSSATLTL